MLELERGGNDLHTHNIWILLGAAGKKIRKGSFLSVSRAFLGRAGLGAAVSQPTLQGTDGGDNHQTRRREKQRRHLGGRLDTQI